MGLTYDQKMAKLAFTRELVGRVICSSYVTHQKVISYSWILAITHPCSPLISTNSKTVFNAGCTPNRDQLWFDLRVEIFWISWTREQSLNFLSSDRNLAFSSISGSDWHTNKQTVYNWPSDNSSLRPHRGSFASSRPCTPFVSLSA